jgi:hypothetical protein
MRETRRALPAVRACDSPAEPWPKTRPPEHSRALAVYEKRNAQTKNALRAF